MQTIVSSSSILQELHYLSNYQRQEVLDFIQFLQTRNTPKPNFRKNLAGVWKHKGFEKIDNLASSLEELRKDWGNSLMTKEL